MLDIELWIAVAAVVLPVLVWGIRRYLVVMSDGIVTLNELLQAVVDAVPIINKAVDEVEDVIEVSNDDIEDE